jgi:hypothetical protein
MATCKECLHYRVCAGYGLILDPLHGGVICEDYKRKEDVVEVVHGCWEEVKYIEGCLNPYKHTCSRCGKSYFDNNSNNYPFCPLCGAKMDRERRSDNG